MIVAESHGSLFYASAQTLVCPVNTVGVMGAGLALAFKTQCPGLFMAYRLACHDQHFERHGMWLYVPDTGPMVLCLPTKEHWAQMSWLDLIERSLKVLVRDYDAYGLTSIAMPKIGCGRGGLPWDEVRPLIYHYLDPLPDLEVTLYV